MERTDGEGKGAWKLVALTRLPRIGRGNQFQDITPLDVRVDFISPRVSDSRSSFRSCSNYPPFRPPCTPLQLYIVSFADLNLTTGLAQLLSSIFAPFPIISGKNPQPPPLAPTTPSQFDVHSLISSLRVCACLSPCVSGCTSNVASCPVLEDVLSKLQSPERSSRRSADRYSGSEYRYSDDPSARLSMSTQSRLLGRAFRNLMLSNRWPVEREGVPLFG